MGKGESHEAGGSDMNHENSRRIKWDYEATYYHIYPTTDLLDRVLDPLIIETPQSAQNDVDLQGIVDALNRIASRWILGKGSLQALGHGSSVLKVCKRRQHERLG